MKHTKYLAMIALIIVLVLAACSTAKPATSSTSDSNKQLSSTSSNSNSSPQPTSTAAGGASQPQAVEQSLEEKLAVGTLKLEGTDQAVTAEQAAALLPLWKAVKSLSSSETASQDEITALYNQIAEAMTSEQVEVIENLSLTQEDMAALMETLGIEAPQVDNGTQGGSDRPADQGQMPGNMAGQMPAPEDGGTPPSGGVGGPGGQAGERPDFQGTPPAGMGSRGAGRGIHTLFVDSLIQMLEERASS